jgi:hypothetical protein
MPVRIWGGSPAKEVFISIERTPLVLADLRKALPKLQRELAKKWPVESVSIQLQKSRIKNPTYPSQLIIRGTCVGLAIRLLGPSVDVAGKELSKYVKRWIKTGGKTKGKKKRKTA